MKNKQKKKSRNGPDNLCSVLYKVISGFSTKKKNSQLIDKARALNMFTAFKSGGGRATDNKDEEKNYDTAVVVTNKTFLT